MCGNNRCFPGPAVSVTNGIFPKREGELNVDSLQITKEIELEDVLHCILLETYPDRPFSTSDTIPLTSYTSGALREILVDGKLLQGGSYCDVRNAKLSPQEWHKAFDMKEYIWFELLFVGK